MDVFISIFVNLLPLYAFIALGFFSGQILKVDRKSLASLAIYIFMPIVVFGFVADMDFEPSYIALPLFLYSACVITGLSFYALGKRIYGSGNNQANLLAMCSSMGNVGYFGLPLVMLFFDKEIVAIYIFMMLGVGIYEATFGYYFAARSNFSIRDSLIKLLKFPTIYAMSAGFIVNALNIEFPEMFWTNWTYVKGAYVVVGMMIIGCALAGLRKFVFDLKFVALVFSGKFLVIPLLGALFIWLDSMMFHSLTEDLRHIVILITIVPPAANIAAFAAQLDIKPEKAATTILLGTIFALFYIPAIVWLVGI